MKAKQRRRFPTSPLEKPKPRNFSKLPPKQSKHASPSTLFFSFSQFFSLPKITKENSSTKQNKTKLQPPQQERKFP
jgi:hypothetical protein